ncbi:MAG: hypothetical protein E4H26_06655, partial [Flavobacteriales bacterium]
GPQGPAGNDGADGAVGPQGPAGNDGADGAVGPQGPIGLTGPQGPAGNDGADGAVGPQGPQGPAGNDGAVGPQGPAGNDGAVGPQGPAGNDGADGAVGPQGPQGPAGNDGADGADGAVGPQGPQGPAGNDGAVGPAGPQGPQGDPATNITTNLTQNTGTGVITYTNETATAQTANVVGAESNNSISVGANGGAYFESPIKAFGKIAANGNLVRSTPGVTITKLSGSGHYRVNLGAGLVSDANYIIQLSQPGRAGAGNDDPGIAYENQTATSFEVIIGDNDNGGTNRARYDSEFMFTILDL